MDALKIECMDPVVEQDYKDQGRQMIKDEKDVKEKSKTLKRRQKVGRHPCR